MTTVKSSKFNLKQLITCVAIPLIIGGVSALLTNQNMQMFGTLNQPPLSPPAKLFPIAWTILYVLMGVASYIVYNHNYSETHGATKESKNALLFYGIQLVFNFFWSLIFFNLKQYYFAFVWLIIMWILILITTMKFYNIKKCAGILMIPYILWVSFAAYLNLGIAILN